MGAPVRAASARAILRRLPALLRRGRAAGASDDRRARARHLRGEAAKLALGDRPDEPSASSLVDALVAFDEVGAHAALDRLLSSFTLDSVLRDSVLRRSTSSASAGSAPRSRSARSTSPATCCAGACSVSRAPGSRPRPPGSPRVPGGRVPRPLADRVRARAARARLAHRLPRCGHAAGDDRGDGDGAAARPRRGRVCRPSRLTESADALRSLGARFPLALAGAGADEALVARIGARRLLHGPVEAAAVVASSG